MAESGLQGLRGHLLGGTCEQASSSLEVTFISHSSRPWAPSSWRTPAVCLSVCVSTVTWLAVARLQGPWAPVQRLLPPQADKAWLSLRVLA